MYNVTDFGNMLTDTVRLEAFRAALQEVVPGRRVLEIGGGTGFFACLAASLGAAHVTSIDTNKLIACGPVLAEENGLSNIEFVNGHVQNLQKAAGFDVIVHDLRGNTPFFERSMATLKDASRLLRPHGRFLPGRDRVYAALVEDPETYAHMEGVWGGHLAGLDLRSLRVKTHRRLRYQASKEARIWEPQLIADIDYHNITDDSVESVNEFVADRCGTSHGAVIWFETELTRSVLYTTNPWAPSENRATTYGVVFLPWARPVSIQALDSYRLQVTLDERGGATCRLSQRWRGDTLLLASFSEGAAGPGEVQLPAHFRFAPHPLISAYRGALQGIERGCSVPAAVQRIRDSCPEVEDDKAALTVLLKCVEWTQVRARRGRERVARLGFGRHRVRLLANSKELQSAALEVLSPSWRPTRSRPNEAIELRLEEAYRVGGSAYRLSVGGESHSYATLSRVMEQLELLVLWRVLLAQGEYILLNLGYTLHQGCADLVPGEPGEFCLLDRRYRVVPYRTGGGDVSHTKPVPLGSVSFGAEWSKAQKVSSLLGKCGNVEQVPDPLGYFAELLERSGG